MLAIRMQRTGRKGHAQFRMIVQESHRSPKSGNIVISLGSYDPHTKAAQVDKEKASYYLEHGAQPSSRVAALLQKEGVKLPSWVKTEHKKDRAIKNSEKLRRNQPKEETPEPVTATAAEEVVEPKPEETATAEASEEETSK